MFQQLADILAGALAVVKDAGKIIAEHHKKPRNIRYKGRIDLLTETDLAVEEFLKNGLHGLCSGATFMAEESCADAPLGECTWIIDPVDGTTNFVHGLPFVASSVALWMQGRIVLGIVNAPLLGECFWATLGGGACCNGTPIAVSNAREMEQALVATGFPYTIARDADALTVQLNKVLKSAQGMRRCGAAAIDLAFLAAGRFDVFYENGLKPWDVAAGKLLIEEAGGRVTRYDGSPYRLGDGEILASATPELHEAMQNILIPISN